MTLVVPEGCSDQHGLRLLLREAPVLGRLAGGADIRRESPHLLFFEALVPRLFGSVLDASFEQSLENSLLRSLLVLLTLFHLILKELDLRFLDLIQRFGL